MNDRRETPDGDSSRRRRPLGASYRTLLAATTVSNLGDGIGQIASPWLASAITRNPLLVALVAVAQRLPWLVFTLPAGVITDRIDRRRAMVAMNTLRGLLTLGVAFAVWSHQGSLPGPDEVDQVVSTEVGLYLVVLAATLLLGMAEVLADNCGQTLMPSLVASDDLERANGRLWAAEGVANGFAGPPLGSLLLLAAFSLPFFVDAATFFAAAALIALIPGTFRAAQPVGQAPQHWRADLRDGVRWLWAHPVLRPMAIVLGLMNMASMLGGATLVLFAQEVLEVGPLVFTLIGFGGAVGGIVAGAVASQVSRRLGSGTCLALTLGGSAVVALVIFLVPWWPVVTVMFAITALLGMLWNVITVSFRQTIIPGHLLGRVNSVYRFFAWGMMPIGAALGGVVVACVDAVASRDWALRSVWLVDAAVHLGLFVVGRRTLTTERLDAARAAASGEQHLPR